jgi:rhamnulokinase
MEPTRPYLAFDIGAGNGRAFLCYVAHDTVKLQELHRFENKPVLLGGSLYWDLLRIWDNMLASLKKCLASGISGLAGIGIDTWNCDFGLLDKNGTLLGNPLSYRDQGPARTARLIREKIEEKELYRITGIGYNTITALSRFVYMNKYSKGLLKDVVNHYLPLPDLLKYFLSGVKQGEETVLWGSQLMDISTRTWSKELLQLFDIPTGILPQVIQPGTVAGETVPEIQESTGVSSAPVVAVASHDTISATLACFNREPEIAFVCAGTWSILGILVDHPIVSDEAFRNGFLNEIAFNSILFAKNMMGFYLLEELIKIWKIKGIDCSYGTLIERASSANQFTLFLDINDPVFFSLVNAEETVYDYLKKTGQEIIDDAGVLVRTMLESMALSYKEALSDLEVLTERKIRKLVLLGGGTKNKLLCQMTADACDVEVIAGPSEATVIGNLGMQALAVKQLDSVDKFHDLIKRSFPETKFTPVNPEGWSRYKQKRKK